MGFRIFGCPARRGRSVTGTRRHPGIVRLLSTCVWVEDDAARLRQLPRLAHTLRRALWASPSPSALHPPRQLGRLSQPGRRAAAMPHPARTVLEQRRARAAGRGHRTEASLGRSGRFTAQHGGRPSHSWSVLRAARPRWSPDASLLVSGACPCGRVVWGAGGDLAEVHRGREHAQGDKQPQGRRRSDAGEEHTVLVPPGTGLPRQAPLACGQGSRVTGGPAVPAGSAWLPPCQ